MAPLYLFTLFFVLAAQQTVFAEDSVGTEGTIGEENLKYEGCYPLGVLGPRVNVTLLKEDTCLAQCLKWGNTYTAYKNSQLCHCLKSLTGVRKLADSMCPFSCEKFVNKRCGGSIAASMYSYVNATEGKPVGDTDSPWYTHPLTVFLLLVVAVVILLVIGHVTLLAWRNSRRVMIITD